MTAEEFFKELDRLINFYPKQPNFVLFSENCDLANQSFYSKNSKYIFDSAYCDDCIYTYDSAYCAKCIDCDYTVESQLCYECTDAIKCYNANYLDDCRETSESSYCSRCIGCHDCFGCVKLNNKSFCLFNRQLSEQDYRDQVKKYQQMSPEKVIALLEELKLKYPKTQTHEGNNSSSSYGDYFFYNKNCYSMFDASNNENCAYLYDSFRNKMIMDATYCSQENEISYQIVDSAKLFNCNYTAYCNSCVDSSYLFDCFGIKNSLGCVKLDQKQYCLLNRQLSKEEFEKESKTILDDIKAKQLEWGPITFR